MSRFAKPAAALFVITALIAVGSLMPQPGNAANTAGPQPVLVTNSTTSPVPVNGTVTGSVAASQAGSWNVGISGTPTVTIASGAGVPVIGNVGITSMPNVTLAPNAGVTVSNTQDNAVPVWVQNHTAGFTKFLMTVTPLSTANGVVGDVRSFPRLRLIVNCVNQVGNGEYLVSVLGGDADLVIDTAETVNGNWSKVYDLPARQLGLTVTSEGAGGQCTVETLVLVNSN